MQIIFKEQRKAQLKSIDFEKNPKFTYEYDSLRDCLICKRKLDGKTQIITELWR